MSTRAVSNFSLMSQNGMKRLYNIFILLETNHSCILQSLMAVSKFFWL